MKMQQKLEMKLKKLKNNVYIKELYLLKSFLDSFNVKRKKVVYELVFTK